MKLRRGFLYSSDVIIDSLTSGYRIFQFSCFSVFHATVTFIACSTRLLKDMGLRFWLLQVHMGEQSNGNKHFLFL